MAAATRFGMIVYSLMGCLLFYANNAKSYLRDRRFPLQSWKRATIEDPFADFGLVACHCPAISSIKRRSTPDDGAKRTWRMEQNIEGINAMKRKLRCTRSAAS
jgi:hypothetical protein